jgi:hypothetical protein
MESTEITMEAPQTENNVNNNENNVNDNSNNNSNPSFVIPEKLTQQQALQILIDAARVSQSKGIFTLDDAELVNKAIKAFTTQTGPVPSM